MTIYDIPNIEHCDIRQVTENIVGLTMHDGWYAHKSTDPAGEDENGNPTIMYRTSIVIFIDREDLSGIEIVAEADLPANAEICGDANTDNEVM